MDRNTLIGFILIGALMVGMFYFNSKGNQAYLADQKRIEDSIARFKKPIDAITAKLDSLKYDSARKVQSAGAFQQSVNVAEQLTVVENNVLKITFTNKGGQPKQVELKNFKTAAGKPLILQEGAFNKLSYGINSGTNQTAQTADLSFVAAPEAQNADKSKSISFSIKDSTGREIVHQYTLRPDDYLIDFSIIMNGADRLVTKNTINLLWQTQTPQLESDISYEKQQSHICYLDNDKYDFEMIGVEGNSKKFDVPVNWLAVKQQFFITTLINKNKFQAAEINWTVPADTALHTIAKSIANATISLPAGSVAQVPLQLYYGPSDYNILKAYHNDMESIVPYGSGVFA
ncbi:MAG: membrane protein insertase YidC, partial [Sphingobacteriales bacterium]|nr:membrane protein insertase YidC [Sphingobacteriales bacterium]